MELQDFRTVHRVHADSKLVIQWYAPNAKGEYNTWVNQAFTSASNEDKQKIIDKWITNHPNKPKSCVWTITKITI
jgi:hypothetical protein